MTNNSNIIFGMASDHARKMKEQKKFQHLYNNQKEHAGYCGICRTAYKGYHSDHECVTNQNK